MDSDTPVNDSTYLEDIESWIRYYSANEPTKSIVGEPFKRKTTKVEASSHSNCHTTVGNTRVDIVPIESVNKHIGVNMQELVSPVQGTVQQARAEYARTPPIKRRAIMKKRTKKLGCGSRRTSKKKPGNHKTVKRLKTKQHKKKRKLSKKLPKQSRKKKHVKKRRDIFVE